MRAHSLHALIAVVLLTLVCGAQNVACEISFREVAADLLCEARSSGVPLAESLVGGAYNITCDSARNTYTRLRFDAAVSSNTDEPRATFWHEILALPTRSASDDPRASSASGCMQRDASAARSPYCSKIELPLRTSNGSLTLASDAHVAHMLGLGSADIPHVVQGYNVSIDIGHVRWAYELDPLPNTVIPYDYEFSINDTEAAYNAAREAARADGLITKLARCYPPLTEKSARIGGTLNGCFRAACNCSGVSDKRPDVPDRYTYELQWSSPGCQVRRVREGVPRLTADVRVRIEALVKVRGAVLWRGALLSQNISDVTAALATSSGLGSLWSGSGVQEISQRAYSSTGPFQFALGEGEEGLTRVRADAARFGAASSSPLLRVRAALKRAFVGAGETTAPRHDLSGTTTRAASIAHFKLGGGYVLDCLSDAEVGTNAYRTSATNPYNRYGLPSDGLPPDRWLFLSDAVSRRGALFNTHLRESCGLLGTSSAAIALGGSVRNRTLCCDGSLLDGACVPGSGHANAFASPAQVLANATLWRASFVPRGFRQFNYYLFGRNKLYAQPTRSEVSGLAPLLNGAINGAFNVTLEISDMLLRARENGSDASSHLVAPLRFATEEDARRRAYASAGEPMTCRYKSDGSGRGIVAVQKLCNVASSAASADVALTFKGCGSLRLHDANGPRLDGAGAVPVNAKQLEAGACYDVFTVPIYVPEAANVSHVDALGLSPPPTCDTVTASSTAGSTADATFTTLVCRPLRQDWEAALQQKNRTLRRKDVDPDCEHCDSFDFDCLGECDRRWTTGEAFVVFWLPVVIGGTLLLGLFIGFVCARVARKRCGAHDPTGSDYHETPGAPRTPS